MAARGARIKRERMRRVGVAHTMASTRQRNDAEKSHRTDFSPGAVQYRKAARGDDSLNSLKPEFGPDPSPIMGA